jgi:KaiC/GvpD/RAD55 family RecA-like ATPase
MVLLVGPPGSGKTTFSQQVILQNLALDRPIIYVITEHNASEAERALRQRGLGAIEAGLLNLVDACMHASPSSSTFIRVQTPIWLKSFLLS